MYQDVSVMDLFTSYPPQVWCGLIAAIITVIIEVRLISKGKFCCDKKNTQRIESARQAGRMVSANMVSCRYKERDPSNKTINRMYVAQYEYILNGKTKTKQLVTTGVKPPGRITLYYDEGGKKAYTKDEHESVLDHVIPILLPLAVALIVMYLLGFDGQSMP